MVQITAEIGLHFHSDTENSSSQIILRVAKSSLIMTLKPIFRTFPIE